MTRFVKTRPMGRGLPPGSLVYIGDEIIRQARMTLVDFNPEQVVERVIDRVEDALPYTQNQSSVTWIQIEGLSDPKMIEELGRVFEINTLWLEDILNTDHRPKTEELDDFVFIILKAIAPKTEKKKRISFEQISLLLGKGFVISFKDRSSDLFNPILERIQKAKGKIRTNGADYLFYALIDVAVESYFPVLEALGADVEKIEAKVTESQETDLPKKISRLKSDIVYLKKSALPLKESLNKICRLGSDDFQPKTLLFLQDAYEDSVQITDVIDSYRELLSGLLDVYHGSVQQKMNEVMKFLTIFASIFIPLTFVVGIYGMNFKAMPELDWEWGYPLIWVIMVTMAGSMLYYFRKRGWF